MCGQRPADLRPAVTLSVAKRKGTNATELSHRLIDKLEQDYSGFMVSMPLGHGYPHETAVVTPTGPRDLKRLKPSTSKGIYVKRVTLSTTMGPGIKVENSLN